MPDEPQQTSNPIQTDSAAIGLTPLAQILSDIKNSVDTRSSTEVKEQVLSHYTDKEIRARVEKTVLAIEAAKAAEAELKKKPDQQTYDGSGNEIAAVYSKAQNEARTKTRQKLDRLKDALNDVFNQGKFDKLNKLKLDASGKMEDVKPEDGDA